MAASATMSSSPLFVLAVILILSAHPSFALFQTSSGRDQDLTEEEGAAVYLAINNLLETFNGFDTSNWFDSGFSYANVQKINDNRIAIRYVRWTELCTVGTWEKAMGDLVLKDFTATVTYLRPYLLQGHSWAAISNGYSWIDYYLLHKDDATLQLPSFNVSNHGFSTAVSSNGEYLPSPRSSSSSSSASSSLVSIVSRHSPLEKTGFLHCPVLPLVLLSHNNGIWDVLKVGEYLISANKRIRLTMQKDCDLVLSDMQSSRVLWSSKTSGHGSKCFLRLQSDGKLVIYKGNGKDETAVWAINLVCEGWGVKFSSLVIEDDGNLVLYRSQEGKLNRIWATKTKV